MSAAGSTVAGSDPAGRRWSVQLVRFAVVGGAAAVLDFGTLQLLLLAGLPHPVARTCSFVVGTTFAYFLNRAWAFGVPGGRSQATRFAILYGTTYLVVLAVYTALIAALGPWTWASTVAWAASQGTGTAINFVLLRLLVFRPEPPGEGWR
jgi:putative flippase GtrA